MGRSRGAEITMRIAAIDIGTNTVLLLVADIDTTGTITTLAFEQRIPRLGKDVDAERIIGRAAFDRVTDVLREYTTICERLKPDRIVAAATSAVREANNRDEFIAYIKEQTGISIEVLSGEEEARLAYDGAISGVNVDGDIAVLDIGGGSTEITVGTRQKIHDRASFNIGSVRLTEKFFKHDPPTPEELDRAREFVAETFSQLPKFDFAGATTIGVAGTVTTLAALDQGLKDFQLEKIANHRLTRSAVNMLLQKLQTMKAKHILALSSTAAGREDILTAGTLILYMFMKHAGVERIMVSERGVRYGLALREWRR